MTEEINDIVNKLSKEVPQIISGRKDDKIKILGKSNLIHIYTNNSKVFAVTEKGEYTLKLRLYELEKRLDTQQFVRISNSEIINLTKVKNFDINFVGTICARLSNDTVTYVSRRYVSKIKKYWEYKERYYEKENSFAWDKWFPDMNFNRLCIIHI